MGLCVSRSKPKNVILAMKREKTAQSQIDNFKFLNRNEIKILGGLFKELSLINLTGKKLEKFGFLSYFKLPVMLIKGLFGIKLFEIFDRDHNHFIDVEEFISGIECFCRETYEEKVQLVFRLFCFSGNDFINEDDLYLALHHLLNKLYRIEFVDETVRLISLENICHNTHNNLIQNATTNGIELKKVSKSLLARYSNQKPIMSLNDFSRFISDHPEIQKFIQECFNEAMWESKIEETAKQSPQESDIHSDHVLNLKCNSKQYASIVQDLIIFYSDEMKSAVVDVVYLPGSILKIENNKFNIHSKPDSHPRSSFIVLTPEKLEPWEEKLRKTTKIKNFSEEFELKDLLGSGKYSEVYKAFSWKTKQLLAVKIVKKYGNDILEKHMVFNEFNLLQLVNHKNLVRFNEFIETPSHYYILQELAEGKTLNKVFQGLTENEKKKVLREVLSTLEYLHSIGIVHRDVKMENIVVIRHENELEIKLIDFGLSELKLPNKKSNWFCGTVAYMAPEFHLKKDYSESVDLWSLGVMAYTMIAKKFPFNGINEKEIIDRILVKVPDYLKFSEVQRDFVEKLLSKEPEMRPSASQALEHPWILSINNC